MVHIQCIHVHKMCKVCIMPFGSFKYIFSTALQCYFWLQLVPGVSVPGEALHLLSMMMDAPQQAPSTHQLSPPGLLLGIPHLLFTFFIMANSCYFYQSIPSLLCWIDCVVLAENSCIIHVSLDGLCTLLATSDVFY